MILGVHISGAAKIYETIDIARALGCDTMQIFSRSPQRWRDKFLSAQDIAEFNRRQSQANIKPLFIHIPYLINLASPDTHLYEASIQAYIEDVEEAGQLGADYIVTHMGSHKATSEDAGIKRLTVALNRILTQTKRSGVGILLENTSGSGSWLGYTFRHQRKILGNIAQKKRVGLCLDTAHAYLAGYNIATPGGLKEMLTEIDTLIGLSQIKLIHLNDAGGKLGCKHDRHAHIGRGGIGLAGMKRIVTHAKLRNIPFILETPKDTPTADKENLALVRKIAGAPA